MVQTGDALVAAVARLGGVASRPQLVGLGFSGYYLTARVRRGDIHRLRRSRYCLPTLDPATRAAVALGGRLGGLSAARTYGWWTGLDDRVHVSWPPNGNVAKPGRVSFVDRRIVHHWRVLRGSERSVDLAREGPLETLAQVLVSADRDTAIACADSAIRTGVLDESSVRQLLRSMPLRVSEWERYLDGRSDSGLETIVRAWLIDRDIPFEFHAVLPGIGEVDFVIGRSLILETDGSQFHDSAARATRDADRDAAASIWGFVTVRARYSMVMFDPETWQRRVLEHLDRSDHLRHIG